MINANPKKKIEGVIPPLFDRLMDLDPFNPDDDSRYLLLDFESLEKSVIEEVELILNTRRSAKTLELDTFYVLPQHFGMADFSWFDPESELSRHHLAQEITKTLEHFEPRLQNIATKIYSLHPHTLALTAEIAGDLKIRNATKRIIFPVKLDSVSKLSI